MKKIAHILFLFPLVALLAGCATPYARDRMSDAKDIFTATVGKGFGVKARLGPIHPGVFLSDEIAGLRGGATFRFHDTKFMSGDWRGEELTQPIVVPFLGIFLSGFDSFDLGDVTSQRGKTVSAMDFIIFSFTPDDRHIAYYTQIEVAAGLWRTLRLGFNPAEALDFLLGWTTIDILGDDINTRKRKAESNHALEDTARKFADPQR